MEPAITMTDAEIDGTITTGTDKVQIGDLTELVERLAESGVQPQPRGFERYVGLPCLAWLPHYAINGVIIEAGQHGKAVRLDPDDRPSDEREIVNLSWSEIQVYADKLLGAGIVPEAAPTPVQAPPAAIGGKLGDTIAAVRKMAELVALVDNLDGKGDDDWTEGADSLSVAEAALIRYLGSLAAEEVEAV